MKESLNVVESEVVEQRQQHEQNTQELQQYKLMVSTLQQEKQDFLSESQISESKFTQYQHSMSQAKDQTDQENKELKDKLTHLQHDFEKELEERQNTIHTLEGHLENRDRENSNLAAAMNLLSTEVDQLRNSKTSDS
jgi:chromosome segregation ATPase